MATGYFLKLNRFEGPLDLLLYLIRLNEMDIFEVNLAQLAEQYLSHLRLIQFSDLKDASAFLVMGATLCEIKTRRLLPHSEKNEGVDGQAGEIDLEAQLKERLLDYQKYREAGEFFSGMDKQTDIGYSPVGEWERLEKEYGDKVSPLYGEGAVLVVLYEQLLSALMERNPTRVKTTKEMITIERVIEKMLESLKICEVFMFQSMYAEIKNRYELIAHILALLQLLKQVGNLRCYQDVQYGPLWVYWYDESNPEGFIQKIREVPLGEFGI
jgi:segregation and condensation protein A